MLDAGFDLIVFEEFELLFKELMLSLKSGALKKEDLRNAF